MVPPSTPILISFWLLSLSSVALAGVHHVSYQHLISPEGIPDLPKQLGVLRTNDLILVTYDSNTDRVVPQNGYSPSDQDSEEFWKARWTWCLAWYSWVESEYQGLVQELNASSPKSEPYYLQILKTCKLDDTTGTILATTRYSLNGEDILHYQSDQKRWLSMDSMAWHVAERWNREGETSLSYFTPQRCMWWIESSTQVMAQKTAQPTVHLVFIPGTQEQPPHLICQVMGFFPRDIEVTWERRGQVAQGEQVTSGIWPNEDHTFQVQVSIEVGQAGIKPTDHVCVVRHSSLGDGPLRVTWVTQDTGPMGVFMITAGCILAVLGAMVLGWYLRRRRRRRIGVQKRLYHPAQTQAGILDFASDMTEPSGDASSMASSHPEATK